MALILLMAPEMAITSANCAMMISRNQSVANSMARSLPVTAAATAAVNSRPANIQANACVRIAAESFASGLTPTAEGDA